MIQEEEESSFSRRRCLAAGGALGLTGLAGCTDLIFGETLEFAASPSRVSQAALDGTGYERTDQRELEETRTFEAGGESQEVSVTNVMVEYRKTIDAGPLGEAEGAIFSSLTTPQVNILGQEFNPVEDMDSDEIAEMVQQQYDGVENLRQEEETNVTIQGEPTTQTKYRADAAFDGSPVDLFVHVSEAVKMGDDFVVTVGAYPEVTPGEEENILGMMEAVEPDT